MATLGRRRILWAGTVAVLGNLAALHPALAATAVACSSASLISAINGANAASTATLSLSKGCVYSLTTTDNSADGGNGLPVITGNVTIQGNGAIIKRTAGNNGSPPPFRFFDVAKGANLAGGAIDNNGTLSVTGATLLGNHDPGTNGASGGAIQNGEQGTLTVRSTLFYANSAEQEGGAIFNQGKATITASQLSHNTATQFGGGALSNVSVPSSTVRATLSVGGSVFAYNSGPHGGAIDNDAQVVISGSSFLSNSGGDDGGAVYNQGTVTVVQSTFSSNSAVGFGGGALANVLGFANVLRSTFNGNSAIEGGAIDNSASLGIVNSTFAANSAGSDGGGAIANAATANITQTTLAGNSAANGADVHTFCSGQKPSSSCFSKLYMTIVAGGSGGPNCSSNFTGPAPVSNSGYNLDDGMSCGFSGSGSLSNANPMLGSLQNNGGTTDTMALQSGSPALDAAPSSASRCANTVDERGVTRPQGSGCDIGAYELVGG
jgi:hypothetical protein